MSNFCLVLAIFGIVFNSVSATGFPQQLQNQTQTQRPDSVDVPSFEVASIKPTKVDGGVVLTDRPGGFIAQNASVKLLIEYAYAIKPSQLSGGASWTNSERYDIRAKTEDLTGNSTHRVVSSGYEQTRQMLQLLLADRFRLTLRHETRKLPVYALVVSKKGFKLHAASLPVNGQSSPQISSVAVIGRGQITLSNAPLLALTEVLSRQLERLVIDNTGLQGKYNLVLQWTPNQMEVDPYTGKRSEVEDPADASGLNPSGPSIFAALQEQLGLKLESRMAPVDVTVINHVERPSEN